MNTLFKSGFITACLIVLASCGPNANTTTPQTALATNTAETVSPIEPTAGVQDLMVAMIDPAADFLWDAVATIQGPEGIVEKKPHTDAEWAEVRRQAIILTEGANLLQIKGRHVVKEGEHLEDEGTPGNLTAVESEQEMINKWAAFVNFSQELRNAGSDMLHAIDNKDTEGMLVAGNLVDEACESCHLVFWYPGQYIPPILESDLQANTVRQ